MELLNFFFGGGDDSFFAEAIVNGPPSLASLKSSHVVLDDDLRGW
jgi:hypothetical protein